MSWSNPVTLSEEAAFGHLDGNYGGIESESHYPGTIYWDESLWEASWISARDGTQTLTTSDTYVLGPSFQVSGQNYGYGGDFHHQYYWWNVSDGDWVNGNIHLDTLINSAWQAYKNDQGFVEGVDYASSADIPEDERYLNYEWSRLTPGDNTVEVLPGGGFALHLDGLSTTESQSTVQLKAIRPIWEIRRWVNGGPPPITQHFSWPSNPGGYGTLLHSVAHDDMVVNSEFDFDITTLLDSYGGVGLHLTVDFHRAAPPESGIVSGGPASSLTTFTQLRHVARWFPTLIANLQLPPIRWWLPVIPPLRLRGRDDDTPDPVGGAEPSIRVGDWPGKSRSVQRGGRIFYGPNTYA